MKVVLKTVSGKQHEAEVEATTTVRALKQTLANEYDVASVRLVHKGSILDDARTMAEVGVAEHDSIVIAGKKRSVAKPSSPQQTATTAAATTTTTDTATTTSDASPASTSAPSAPATATTTTTTAPTTATATTTTPATMATTAPAAATTTASTTTTTPAATAPATTPATTTATTPAATAAASSTAGVDASLIDSIVAMGFDDRAQVALALRAAYMNADRAVEYLFAGIPAARLRELNEAAAMRAAAEAASHAPHTTTTATATAAAAGAGGEGSSGGGDGNSSRGGAAASAADRDALQQLRSALYSIPQFEHVREVFRQNAASMPAILQQIAQRYPAVYALVQQYPDHFLSIMHETTGQGGAAAAATAAGRVGAGGAGRAGPVQPSELLSHMSDAELADVQELVTLGGGLWDAPAAALVYVATRADKEMAASVLFEHGGVPPALVEAVQHGGLRMRTGTDASGDDDDDDGGEGDEDADN